MIAGVRSRDVRILSACRPVEFTGLDNDTTEGCSVSTDELGCGMYHDVCAVLNRTNQIRGTEGIVDYQGKSVLMCDFRNCLDIGNIAVRVS